MCGIAIDGARAYSSTQSAITDIGQTSHPVIRRFHMRINADNNTNNIHFEIHSEHVNSADFRLLNFLVVDDDFDDELAILIFCLAS